MDSKTLYDKKKKEFITILEDNKLTSDEKLKNLQFLELIENLEIYQTELSAQNKELLEKEQEILEAKDDFEKLFNFAPVAYLQLDSELHILKYNLKAFNLLKFNNFSMKVQNQLSFYIYKDEMLHYINFIAQAKLNDKNEGILKFIKNKSFFYGRVNIEKYLKDQKPYYLVSIIDITKEMEQEALILSQAKNAAMGEMLNMINHQWKQPLSVISLLNGKMDLDIDLGMYDKDNFKNYLNDINVQIEYMTQTAQDFRSFYDESKQKEKLNIKECVAKARKFTEASLKNNSITFEINYHAQTEYEVLGYKNDICQVLITIINNAKDVLKWKEGDRKVELFVSKDDSYIRFMIKNNGDIIPENIIHKIFDQNFTTKQELNGSGLGLYIAKKIIENHLFGKIWVENLENESGVAFYIEIPQYSEKE